MITTHTCVYHENTQKDAEKRLKELKRKDCYREIKSYIIPYNGSFRIYRKVDLTQKTKIVES